MKRNPLLAVSALSVSLVVASLPARAAIETFDVSFTAGGFTSAFGQAVPTDPVTGSFRISFDPTLTYTDSTSGITNTTINITVDSAFAFSYSPTGSFADELVVGGVSDGACCFSLGSPTNDFYLHITNFSTSPEMQQLGYGSTTYSPDVSYFYNDPLNPESPFGSGSVTVTPVTSGVPEPSTWAMMVLGFMGLGYVAYRRSGRGHILAVA